MRHHGDFGIGASVKTPRGIGTVVGRSNHREHLSLLPPENVAIEVARIRSAYGDEWQRLFSIYSVELAGGKVENFESGKLEAADATDR